MIRIAALTLATALTLSSAAAAQSVAAGDDRQLEVPISLEGCTVSGLEAGQVITTLKFTCQAPDVGGGATRVPAEIEMWIVDASVLNDVTGPMATPDNLVRSFLSAAGRADQVGNPDFDTCSRCVSRTAR